MPDYCKDALNDLYTDYPAYGPTTIGWEEFLELGDAYTGEVDAPRDINRPLFRAYTSGSTGPSKQLSIVHVQCWVRFSR